MSNKKISELSELTTPTTTDVFPVVNAGTTKKAQLGNLPISTATQTALDAKEATANKSTDVATDQASNTKYPSVKAVYDWVVGLLTGKQDTLVSGTNIKTVNSTSLLGSGDISITASAAWGGITGTLSNQTDLQNALNGKQIIPYIQSNQASPVIHASDDVNTGVNWTLADTLDFVAGGSSKLRINQTGVTNITVNNSTYISGTELGYLDGVTSAIQTQIDGKQATLVSGTNIKTINSTSLLGSGDISISANPGGSDTQVQYNSSGSFAGSANLTFDGTTLDANKLNVQERVTIEADSTATTQSVAVIESTSTNSGLVLKPNGIGAIMASVPDGTATGGNARGQNAVDLQTARTLSSNRVASGTQSFIGGGLNNQVTVTRGVVVGGENNQVLATSGSIVGGDNNRVSGGFGFIGNGLQNTVSQNYGTISGGQSNTASSGTHATVVGGKSNTASGEYSVAGGFSNVASGLGAVALGYDNTASGSGSVCIGRESISNLTNAISIGYQVTTLYADGTTVKNFAISNYASLDFADDSAAATGGVPIGGVYHTSGALKIRLT